MKDRFENKAALAEEIRTQTIVAGNSALAELIANRADLQELHATDVLVEQGTASTDVFFILAGAVDIEVNGRRRATRHAGTQVGEMAAINPRNPRSATVRASQTTVVARLAQADVIELANEYPAMWHAMARDLAARLYERGDFVPERNGVPRVFIGSSSEGLGLAEALRENIEREADFELELRQWNNADIFAPGSYALVDLLRETREVDFAILVFTPDDAARVRNADHRIPRDNVVFELGLFMGAIGRDRAFVLVPSGDGQGLKLPSDLQGLTTVRYTAGETPGLARAVGEILRAIARNGTR